MKTIRCRPKNLKFDSKMPCLVQLIQDDSPMGYCNVISEHKQPEIEPLKAWEEE